MFLIWNNISFNSMYFIWFVKNINIIKLIMRDNELNHKINVTSPPQVSYYVNLTIFFFLYNYFQTCEWRWLKISKDWNSETDSYALLLSIVKYFLVSLKLKGPLCKQHCDRWQQGQPKAKFFKLIFLTSFPHFWHSFVLFLPLRGPNSSTSILFDVSACSLWRGNQWSVG